MRRLPFVVVLALSIYAFFTPAAQVPGHVPVSDKVVHAGLFAALAVTGRLAQARVLPLAAALAAYAVVSEVLQATLPISRDGNLADAAADLVGVLAGVVVVLLSGRVATRRQNR